MLGAIATAPFPGWAKAQAIPPLKPVAGSSLCSDEYPVHTLSSVPAESTAMDGILAAFANPYSAARPMLRSLF